MPTAAPRVCARSLCPCGRRRAGRRGTTMWRSRCKYTPDSFLSGARFKARCIWPRLPTPCGPVDPRRAVHPGGVRLSRTSRRLPHERSRSRRGEHRHVARRGRACGAGDPPWPRSFRVRPGRHQPILFGSERTAEPPLGGCLRDQATRTCRTSRARGVRVYFHGGRCYEAPPSDPGARCGAARSRRIFRPDRCFAGTDQASDE